VGESSLGDHCRGWDAFRSVVRKWSSWLAREQDFKTTKTFEETGYGPVGSNSKGF